MWHLISQMFFKIGVLKNFTICTGKHLCWSLFLMKLQAWRPATLLKIDSNTGVYLWMLYCEILKTPFFIEHLCWLLLYFRNQKFLWSKTIALYEKCPITEFFLIRIQSKCGKIRPRKKLCIWTHFTQFRTEENVVSSIDILTK